MDRTEAVAEQLRAAHAAEGVLDGMRAPRVEEWIGPAAAAATERLHRLDADLADLRGAVHEWGRAIRTADG